MQNTSTEIIPTTTTPRKYNYTKKTGRPYKPNLLTPEQKINIINMMSSGMSVDKICRLINCVKDYVYQQCIRDDEFYSDYRRAREIQCDALADKALDIYDLSLERCKRDGIEMRDAVQAAKVELWAHQWYASKVAPKRYGDKVEVEHVGGVNKQGGIVIEFIRAKISAPVIDVSSQTFAPPTPFGTPAARGSNPGLTSPKGRGGSKSPTGINTVSGKGKKAKKGNGKKGR